MLTIVLLIIAVLSKVQSNVWWVVTFSESRTNPFIAKFPTTSAISCIVYCFTDYTSESITLQDGYCYCITSLPVVNTSVTITTMSKIAVKTDCRDESYKAYPELGICIKLYKEKKEWANAKSQCVQDGGHLLKMDTAAKFNTSKALFEGDDPRNVYVGGFRNVSGNERGSGNESYIFFWTKGGRMDLTMFWHDGEPNNANNANENCVGLYKLNGKYAMNDGGCLDRDMFLCELDL